MEDAFEAAFATPSAKNELPGTADHLLLDAAFVVGSLDLCGDAVQDAVVKDLAELKQIGLTDSLSSAPLVLLLGFDLDLLLDPLLGGLRASPDEDEVQIFSDLAPPVLLVSEHADTDRRAADETDASVETLADETLAGALLQDLEAFTGSPTARLRSRRSPPGRDLRARPGRPRAGHGLLRRSPVDAARGHPLQRGLADRQVAARVLRRADGPRGGLAR